MPLTSIQILRRVSAAVWGLFLLNALLFPVFAQEADSLAGMSVSELFEKGFRSVESAPANAIPYFREILRRDSMNVYARRQLGSLYVATGESEEALRTFVECQHIAPSDTTLLQIGYLQVAVGRIAEAGVTFDSLATSPNPDIRTQAKRSAAIVASMRCSLAAPWWYRVQASPYYESRFQDVIVPVAAYAGYYLDSARQISLFGVASLIWDTRSEGGALPVIFSDNYVLGAVGVRYSPVRWFTADVQTGMAVDLNERPDRSRVNADVRAVGVIGWGIYADLRIPEDLTFTPAFVLDTYASLGYYTRYRNTIGYGQGRAGARLLSWNYAFLDAYGRVGAAFDARGDFFNNILEGGIGIRVVPDFRSGFAVMVEYLGGTYWRAGQTGNPHGKNYDTVRLILSVDRYFCW